MAVWVNAFTNGTKSLSSNTNHEENPVMMYNRLSTIIES